MTAWHVDLKKGTSTSSFIRRCSQAEAQGRATEHIYVHLQCPRPSGGLSIALSVLSIDKMADDSATGWEDTSAAEDTAAAKTPDKAAHKKKDEKKKNKKKMDYIDLIGKIIFFPIIAVSLSLSSGKQHEMIYALSVSIFEREGFQEEQAI